MMRGHSLVWLLCVAPCLAQSRGYLEGHVTNELTGSPVKDAVIQIQRVGSEENPFAVVTDSAGFYAAGDLAAGAYALIPILPAGFVSAKSTRARRAELDRWNVTLAPGERIQDADFTLTPQGVIAGRVTGKDGTPLASMIVTAIQRGAAAGPQYETNDLGLYRLVNLPPGTYTVLAAERGSLGVTTYQRVGPPEEENVPTYYQQTMDPRAAVEVEVRPGQVTSGIDIQMIRSRLAFVRGVVIDQPGSSSGFNEIRLFPESQPQPGHEVLGQLSPQGRFEFRSVLPGRYTAVATKRSSTAFAVSTMIDVPEAGIETLRVVASPQFQLSGTVHIVDPAGDEFDPTLLQVVLRPQVSRPWSIVSAPAQLDEDGNFTLSKVNADRYKVELYRLPTGYYIRSVRLGSVNVIRDGLDLTYDSGGKLEIVLSGKPGKILGKVIDPGDRPMPGARVLLFPTLDRGLEPADFQSALSDESGGFQFPDLAPGDYKLLALEDMPQLNGLLNPGFLDSVKGKEQAVRVEEGRTHAVQLKAVPR